MSKLMVELERDGGAQPSNHEVEAGPTVLQSVRALAGLGDDAHVFERDKDDEIREVPAGVQGVSLVVSRCKHVQVEVRFEHQTISDSFPPSATIIRVLRWAVGKRGFKLDEGQRGKANLMLPGTDTSLPKDATIARYVGAGCSVVFELTLRDFTNG